VIAIFLGLLATVACGLVGLHDRDEPARPPLALASTAATAVPAFALAAAFLVQLAVVTVAARTQVPFPAWFSTVPLIPIDDSAPHFAHSPAGLAVGACTLIETLAGIALYRAGRGKRFGRATGALVAGAAATMIVAAILTPALTSFDLYTYAGTAHVADAYAAPRHAFVGDLIISPSPYGPVWLIVAKLAVAPFSTLAGQLTALRCLGATSLIACALAVRALKYSAAEVALVALNPGLIDSFVLDGHNDVIAVALVLWAIASQRRVPALGIVCAILAGGMKLPFIAIGALGFAAGRDLRGRLVGAAAIVAGGVAVSALLGGSEYLAAMGSTARVFRFAVADPATNAVHGLLALSALAAIIAAVVAKRYWPSASWSFVALTVACFGWYAAWGLPYAVLERRWLAAFLLSLPGLTFFLSTVYAITPVQNWALTLTVIGAPLAVYLALRRTPNRLPTPVAQSGP
jgi:hypothetical protein